MDWQPIETAPRYEWVMLFEPNGVYDTPGLTHWIAKWVFIDGEFGWFDQDANFVCSNPTHWIAKWVFIDGEFGWFDQDANFVCSNPTHWMPLPPPPHTGATP